MLIRAAHPHDQAWIKDRMVREWGGLPLVIRGKAYNPFRLPGIIAEHNGAIAGFLFYDFQDTNCEIIVFEVLEKFKGTGTLILNELKNIAKSHRCQRIYLMITNDNLNALRFYQKRGFHICSIHIDSVKQSRVIKPTIGLIGDFGIPLRDEIDLEFLL